MLLEKSIFLFLLSYLIGLIAAISWLNFAETWQIFGDAVHYVSIYNGDLAPAPWGYRIMTPYLASLLPWDIKSNFAMVSINSLALIAGVLALYGRKIGLTFQSIFLLVILWIISYPFIYYSSAIVRADAPMLLILAVIFLASHYRVSSFILLILILIGTLFHEMILISIVALLLDKTFMGKLTGGLNYKYIELILITIFSLFFLLIVRSFFIDILPVEDLNIKSLSILEYTGGVIKHALRIYSSYGPLFLYCLFFVFTQNLYSLKLPLTGLLLITISATFYAADTLRVMSILYIPVLLYSAEYISNNMHTKKYSIFSALIILQISYSYTVFGHLRTFESSITLNIIAAIVSIISLAFCIIILQKKLTK